MCPAPYDVRTGKRHGAGAELILCGVIGVALKSDRIARTGPVETESALSLAPVIVCARAVGKLHRAAPEALTIHTECRTFRELAAVANAAGLFLVAPRHAHEGPRSIGRGASDDVDDAIHRIRAPKRGAGTADYFDALDIIERHVERIVEHAGK